MKSQIVLILAALLLFPLEVYSAPKGFKYPELKGKIVRDIKVELGDVFDNENGWLYRAGNKLKINTKEHVIRREVLLKEGKEFNELLMQQSERNLRAYRYLRKVTITPLADGDFVDLIVYAQDTWTIIPQVGFSTGTGSDNVSAGLTESNLLGYGKKIGGLYREQDERQSVEFVYEDPRFWGTQSSLSTGYYDRNDGEVAVFNVGRPYRSYEQHHSWSFSTYDGDTVGRLFANGDERYIFRQQNVNIGARLANSRGSSETEVHRLAIGYDYISDEFQQADESDYDDLNLDPNEVSNDPALLAENRRFTGPSLTYHYIEPDFISRNYVDRFDRVEDYNMGTEYSVNSMIAPEALGSRRDTFLFSANISNGQRLGSTAFWRGELGYASRVDTYGLANSLYRGEFKYYNVLGPQYLGERYIGKHTLAANFFIDYADDLDRDREFLVGSDNLLRGYEAKTFTGDKRLGINLEDRVHLIDDAFQLVSMGAAVFFDAGGATREPLGTLITDEFYSDVGFGLRFAFPRSTGSQVLRVDISFPLRDGPDGSGQFEPRILLSGGQIFDSHLRSETLGAERANLDVGTDR